MELNSVITQLNWRLATKSFDPNKKITDGNIGLLSEALRLTPSSYGLQPWKFLIIKNTEIKEKLLLASYGQKQVVDASHLIVLCTKTSIDQTNVEQYIQNTAQTRGLSLEALGGFKGMLSGFVGAKSKEELRSWAVKQVYIALGNLLTTCAVASIDTCPMEGFDTAAYDQILGLEKLGITATVVCPVGYRLENAPEINEKKVRFPKEEVVVEI